MDENGKTTESTDVGDSAYSRSNSHSIYRYNALFRIRKKDPKNCLNCQKNFSAYHSICLPIYLFAVEALNHDSVIVVAATAEKMRIYFRCHRYKTGKFHFYSIGKLFHLELTGLEITQKIDGNSQTVHMYSLTIE